MLRLFFVALSLFLSVTVSVADTISTGGASVVQVNDSNDVISETQNTPRQSRPVRPQRYVCVVDQSGSVGGGGQVSCPAKPGRVGGRCRCANVTGSGTLYTY
ncbi:hypothetical protein [Rhizobium rhizophilum]|jgi:hypothetical protein|uniref:Uncharacterized protein n=1 Tax=Rhizobium rhizophilum TaxID=1850373 RepID=A0ABY2QY57_9HYPH|nr:hypothetical protein [Rhizobium rhizophilum]THV16556.1 hypothetical protein E9677_00685 [Rhizobium rhizophilum]